MRADGLKRALRQSGGAADCVDNGMVADAALGPQEFDLLILDLGLPKMNSLEVLRRLRARNSLVPVLILTAADCVEQRVKTLDLGADDDMPKPFVLTELDARALTLRGACGSPLLIQHRPLTFDQVGHIACIGDLSEIRFTTLAGWHGVFYHSFAGQLLGQRKPNPPLAHYHRRQSRWYRAAR